MRKNKETITIPANTASIYARYSSANQTEASIDAQVRACMEYAKSKGLDVIKVYVDSAKTGTNAEREQFQQMISDAEKKLFKNLIIHKLDRFSRDKYDAVTYKRKLKISGVTILSVTENLDGSPESLILESMLEGLNQYYSLNLAREVAKGMKEAALKCRHLGGTPPLGLDVDKESKQYVINEPEAKIVRLIFQLYAEGVGYTSILQRLNMLGYKTKQGKPFMKNSLNNLLKNEKYTGRYIFNRKLEKDVTGKRNPQIKPREEWIVVEDGLPAIIDQDTFDKVQEKLVYNLKSGGKLKATEMYLLSGLIQCGVCGAAMYSNSRICGRGKTKYFSYRCSGRMKHHNCSNKEIRKEYVEGFVLDELYEKLFSEHSVKQLTTLLNEYNQTQMNSNNSERSEAERELDAVVAKVSNIVKLVAESGISIDTVKTELKDLEDRKNALEQYIAELSLHSKTNVISEAVITDLITQSQEFVQTKNIQQCRNFIQNYVDRVVVYADQVEVLFKINLPGTDASSVVPLTSGESIKTLQKEYRIG